MNFLICPGSAENQKFKRWPVLNFLGLANQFKLNNHQISIVLGPEEKYLSNYFLNFDLYMSDSFQKLKQLGQKNDLIICNDSFLLHFFSIINCKVLALYGPTDPDRTLPPNAFKISSKKKSRNRPCWGSDNYGKCDNDRCSCFDGLEIEDVFKESLNLLLK